MGTPQWEDRRLAFGAWAQTYDRFRPGYPRESVGWLVGRAAPATVLDLGAGTGRLGAALAALGYDVLAVEPDDGMRAVAESVLPGRTLAGTAEAIPAEEGSVDAVVAGQAFHWFDRRRALPEIARVLRPGGSLGIIWNVRDDRVPWVAELSGLVDQGAPPADGRGPAAPDLGDGFGPVESRVVEHGQQLDADELVGLAGSFSYVALRPDRDEVLDAVRRLALEHPDLAGRDRFVLPYVTRAFRAVSNP